MLGIVVCIVNTAALAGGPFLGVVQTEFTAADGSVGDRYGRDVALDGDTLSVAAHGNGAEAGAVYVYARSGGSWLAQAKLMAADPSPGDRFGFSVALQGDRLVAGAYRDGTAASSGAGSAYVFTRSGGAWTQQARLEAGDASPMDGFGFSVGLDGDTILVGAWAANGAAGNDTGSAYVFSWNGSGWAQQAKLTAADAAEEDFFGYSVALHADTAVVASLYGDTTSGPDTGAVYVFARVGSAWAQQDRIEPSSYVNGLFGVGLSLEEDTLLVGSPEHGVVYVFARAGGSWSGAARLSPPILGSGRFGLSVSLEGDTAVVGAPPQGVFVFARAGPAAWVQAGFLRPPADPAGYGSSVDGGGHAVLVGAPDHAATRGAAYLVEGAV